MKKKILCLFLCLTLMVSLMPMMVSAAGRYLEVDGVQVNPGSDDVSGFGWEWKASERCLYLNRYNGSSIATNGDLKICVNGESTICGSFCRTESSGIECISVAGQLELVVDAPLKFEASDSGKTDWAIRCSELDLTVTDKGSMKIMTGLDRAIEYTNSSSIKCDGLIECYVSFIKGKDQLNLEVNGTVDVFPVNHVEYAIFMESDLAISGSGVINIGNSSSDIRYGIYTETYGTETVLSNNVKLNIVTQNECMNISNLTVKDDCQLNLRSLGSLIDGRDIVFEDNVNLVLSGNSGIRGFDITFANKDITAIMSYNLVYGEHIYYKPTGTASINCGTNVFSVDHGTVYFQGSGTDYITAGNGIVYNEYGGCRWERDGKSILTCVDNTFSCLYEFTGNGDLTITSTKGVALCVNMYGGTNGEILDYNGTLTIKDSKKGIQSSGPINLVGDCDYTIESVFPAIAAVGDVNIGGSGTITAKSDSDAVITSLKGSVNITRDGDISLNDHECIGIYSAGEMSVGGKGVLKVVGDGPVLETGDGDIHICDERSIDAYVTLNVVEFNNPANSLILDGTGSPLSLKSKRDYCHAVTGSDNPVKDSNEAYEITEGNPNGMIAVYELKKSGSGENPNGQTPDGGDNGTTNGGNSNGAGEQPDGGAGNAGGAGETPDGGAGNAGGAGETPDGGANGAGEQPDGGEQPNGGASNAGGAGETPDGGAGNGENNGFNENPDLNPEKPDSSDDKKTLVAGEYTEEDIPVVVITSDEGELSVGDFVTRCYRIALEREPDEEGYEYWVSNLNNGQACGGQVGFGFIFSSEYSNKDKTNEDYVADLYSMFFGREEDTDGYNYWLGMLNDGVSREEVFAGFANSQEFYNLCSKYAVVSGWYVVGVDNNSQGGVNCFVARLYRICLGRLPDLEGQCYWVTQLINGSITGTAASNGFVFSEEFANLGLSDAEFVAYMYAAFFGRQADVDGFNFWLKAMENGMSRTDVMLGFTGSAEFANLCASYGINA